MNIQPTKKIVIAPLNWGLGHATRCIPIINAIKDKGWIPVIASDGEALSLLKKEFPDLKMIELPSYHFQFPANEHLFWHLVKQLPKFVRTMCAEHRFIHKLIVDEKITGIISDNRFGVFSSKIPSVYITHQITVLSGIFTFLTSFIHRKIINRFHECWIPDSDSANLAGNLVQFRRFNINTKYLGIISRLQHKPETIKFSFCILLSGPEPQRSILERILLKELESYKGSVCFIRGVIADNSDFKSDLPFTFYDYLTTADLNVILNQSEVIIARSGYSTILDLATLGKKAFIPTPGQKEQEYLARYLQQQQIAPFCKQSEFTIEKLTSVAHFSGFLISKNRLNALALEIFE